MNEQQLKWVQETYKTGHFWNPEPDARDGWNVKYEDLHKLNIDSPEVVRALQSRSDFQVYPYAEMVIKAHGRAPYFDGNPNPGGALEDLLENEARCWVPDYAPPKGVEFAFPDDTDLQEVCRQMQADAEQPAVGRGNWDRCHGIGDFHSASVNIDRSGIGSHLGPVFLDVLRNIQKSYAALGLLFRFIENGMDLLSGTPFNGNINIDWSFVQRSSGWIGLAIVGQNQACSSRIWCRYLATYRGGSDVHHVVTQWNSLGKHELGHNCGRGHTRGGVMNPSIVRGLPVMWAPSDPSYNWLKAEFGGVPVGGNIPPGPEPPLSLEARVKQLESRQAVDDVKFAVHDALIRHLMNR